jgi:hypothetical protein
MESPASLSDLGTGARLSPGDARPTDIIDLALEEATRIRIEALRAAEESHQAVVNAAEAERDEILAAARDEATRILKIAQLEAERVRVRPPGEREGGDNGVVGGSAKSIVAMAIEEARRVRLAAMREGFVRGAKGEAAEIIGQAKAASEQAIVELRNELTAIDGELRHVQSTVATLLARLDTLAPGAAALPEVTPRANSAPSDENTASVAPAVQPSAEEPEASQVPERSAVPEAQAAPEQAPEFAEAQVATVDQPAAPAEPVPQPQPSPRAPGGIRGLLAGMPRG